jgi:Peptidase family M23/Domain of unknown function (DUF4124)
VHIRSRNLLRTAGLVLGWALATGGHIDAAAQGLYKYKDANGHWVYTDRKPATDTPVESLDLGPAGAVSPHIEVKQERSDDGTVLHAVNGCACPVEFGVRITRADNLIVPGNGTYILTVPPRSEDDLVELVGSQGGPPTLAYDWLYVFGEPGTEHRPDRPYRLPFAVSKSFEITQAYPSTYTHKDPASRYAIDFAMPEGTAIYAAREGTVIDVDRGNFKGGVEKELADKANFVRIMHADGTVAIYAHLRWDSIRVRPGQEVKRGEYIAMSGNTGFSSGPHLHFAVTRNAGLKTESVPVTFEGLGGSTVTPREGESVTAY